MEDYAQDNHFALRRARCFRRSILCDLVITLYPLIPRDALSRDVFRLHRVVLNASLTEYVVLLVKCFA